MPLLKNPDGQIVCVPADIARGLLSEHPPRIDIDGKVLKPGFSVATPEDARRYAEEVKAAAAAAAKLEADALAKSESHAFAVAKGLFRQMKGKGE
jgi:hypothetical protein